MEKILVNKRKILRNPTKKSARELLASITQKEYDVTIKLRKDILITINKIQVPRSLNDKPLTFEPFRIT